MWVPHRRSPQWAVGPDPQEALREGVRGAHQHCPMGGGEPGDLTLQRSSSLGSGWLLEALLTVQRPLLALFTSQPSPCRHRNRKPLVCWRSVCSGLLG